MNLLSGLSEFFGLDISPTAVRMVELKGSGSIKALSRYAYIPIDAKIAVSDSAADHQKLATSIQELLNQAKVTTRNVAVSLPSNKVFTTIVDIEKLPAKELAKTIKYQVDSLIPTSSAESKIDWVVIGDSPKEKGKVEILLTSVANDFVEKRLDILESIGLNVIAFEPDSIALSRAVIAPGIVLPQMVLAVGYMTSDIVITMNGTPRLVRSIPTGTEAILRAAAQNLNIDSAQAQQFVFKFGLNQEKLEGQVFHAIVGTVDILVNEIDKSIKFFLSRYTNSKIDRIIVTGDASTLPELPLYIANKFGLNVEIGNAWRNVSFPTDRQNELLTASNHFGVAAGLAERQE